MGELLNGPPPTLIWLIVPVQHTLSVGDQLVIVTAIEQWTTMIVVHALLPTAPPPAGYPAWPHRMSDDLRHAFATTSIQSVGGGPAVARRLVITSTGTIAVGACELRVQWKQGLTPAIPLAAATFVGQERPCTPLVG